MRVLAVDDDPVCLKVLETLLLRCQYNGMLDMLLDTELETAQRDYAQTAQVYGKALISLINKALGRAKIEANKLELESVT